ncbi:MAG: bactofilin family protein [Phascolarctobacterium faecium]
MFGKNKKDVVAVSTLPLEEFEFLLGRNSILCGNLQTKGASRIDGHFKGIIVSENDVLIGPNGVIEANIFGENVTVAGNVTGNIVARGTLEILASGVLNGDIKAGSLVVEPGAVLRGNIGGIEGIENPELSQAGVSSNNRILFLQIADSRRNA